jgi:hypothetical protein
MGSKGGSFGIDIEKYARPHLALVIKRCADDERKPRDFYLAIEKHTGTADLVLRDAAGEVVGLTEVARGKLVRLLERRCEEMQLLVAVIAGNQVEGDLLRVSFDLPKPRFPTTSEVSRAERDVIVGYLAKYGQIIVDAVHKFGGSIEDYIVIADVPNGSPDLVHRTHAGEDLIAKGYAEFLSELEMQPKANELLMFYTVSGKRVWSRMKIGLSTDPRSKR